MNQMTPQTTVEPCPPTDGPLSYQEGGESNSFVILDQKGDWLLSLLHNGSQLNIKQKANLERLVACWNLCVGIPTTDIAQGVVKAVVQD